MLNRRRLIMELLNSKFRLVKAIKGICFKRKSTMGAADSDELSANKVVETPLESPVIYVPAAVTDSERVMDSSTEATFSTADSTEASSIRVIGMSNKLALISYVIGQMKLMRSMRVRSDVDVKTKQSSNLHFSKEATNGISATMGLLQTYGADMHRPNVNGTDANIGSAVANLAVANISEKTVTTATLCCWDYPETMSEDTITILQANTINYENEILEVI